MNAQFAVVLNETEPAETIHEEANAGARCTHHFGQPFLAYPGNHRFRRAVFAELGKQQQGPGQALFAGIKKVVDQIFLMRALRASR